MFKINVKPMSVNHCWQGKRFKTADYSKYERLLMSKLPHGIDVLPPFEIDLTFGFSNAASDIDNPIKPFLDILQKMYKINDKDVYKLNVLKEITSKKSEFIQFEIKHLELNKMD